MQHLDEIQLVDAVDGRLDAEAAAHANACGTCGTRVSQMRDALRGLAAVGVPEPSPLFWEYFPARVIRALDADAAPRGWFQPAGLVWGGAAAILVVLLLLVPPAVSPPRGEPRPEAVLNPVEGWPEDLDADDAWALVRSVAEEIDYDEARAIGVAPRAGAIERTAMELSHPERAELARLIEQELQRTGT